MRIAAATALAGKRFVGTCVGTPEISKTDPRWAVSGGETSGESSIEHRPAHEGWSKGVTAPIPNLGPSGQVSRMAIFQRRQVDVLAEVQREQRDWVPKEDLTPFVGEWVALRRGRVVDHDSDLAVLRRKDTVRGDDVVLRVPRPEEAHRV